MTGIETAMAVAAVAAAAAGSYVQYEGTRQQAKLGEHSENIKQEQLAMERRTAALQAGEQEAERLRRAGLARSANMAAAAASGLDWMLSPSLQAGDAENRRLVMGDVSSIRLLGAAGQRRSWVEQRVSETAEGGYGALGANAWVTPTISLLGSAASAYGSLGPTSRGGGNPSSAGAPVGAKEPLTGKIAGGYI